ncbi:MULTISPECIES: hypothetical protein [Erwiniaceae]|nr:MULTISPECIES: hypothetical protein [Erwiniaceae]
MIALASNEKSTIDRPLPDINQPVKVADFIEIISRLRLLVLSKTG